MRKVLRVGVVAAAFALTGWVGVVPLAQSSTTSPTTTSPTTTGPTTTSPAVGDGDQFKGPCDEAEHVNDPECQGVTLVPEDNDADDDNGVDLNDDQGDVNDGQLEEEDGDDNSGPSEDSGHSGESSGSGSDDSGHASDDSVSDQSGHGGGDDEGEDD
jgi:hypothetical protein